MNATNINNNNAFTEFTTYIGKVKQISQQSNGTMVLMEIYQNPKLPQIASAYDEVVESMGRYLFSEGFIKEGTVHFAFVFGNKNKKENKKECGGSNEENQNN